MVKELKNLTNPDSLVSLFLGLAVVIVIGVLIVNYVKGRPQMKQQTAAQQEQQNATESAKLPATHTVAAGETLWSIAETTIGSGYNWVDIAKANNMTNPDHITAGEKLTIPSVTKREPGQVSSTSVEIKRPADGKHTVLKGESLWSVSLAVYGTGYRWPDIAKLNKLANPNLIYSGNVLVLP